MPAAAVTKLGCFTQEALDGLIQTNPASTQTLTGSLTVTGTVTAGAVVDGGEIPDLVVTDTLTVGGATDLQSTVALGGVATLATDTKLQFRDTGLFINSGADGKLTISSDGAGADDITLSGTVTTDAILTAGAAIALGAAGFTKAAIARTATADGTGTGAIAAGPTLNIITVTAGGDADAIITLPTPTPGVLVILSVAATGYELRTTDPTTIGINGGTGADAESAIGADTTAFLYCATATSWKGWQLGSDGTLAKVQVAA